MTEDGKILNALKNVQDPELGKSIVELGMVHDIEMNNGTAQLTLALTTMACPLRDSIVEAVRHALLRLDNVQEVQVALREMTPDEKRRIWPKERSQEPGVALHLNHVERVVAIMSGKGGVGKSTVAALLAAALRRQGRRVGVLDADITGPSIPKLFGLHGPPPPGPVGILPAETSTGIWAMSVNLLLPDENAPVVWRGPLISGAIKQFWGDVVWGNLDVLVLDLPPGTSDASLTVMQSIPLNGVLLISSPQDLAGMVVRKAANMAASLNVSIVGLVENMSFVDCPGCGKRIEVFGPSQAHKTASQLGVPLLAQIPLDPELSRLCDAGKVELYRGQAVDELASQVLNRLPAEQSKPIFGPA